MATATVTTAVGGASPFEAEPAATSHPRNPVRLPALPALPAFPALFAFLAPALRAIRVFADTAFRVVVLGTDGLGSR